VTSLGLDDWSCLGDWDCYSTDVKSISIQYCHPIGGRTRTGFCTGTISSVLYGDSAGEMTVPYVIEYCNPSSTVTNPVGRKQERETCEDC
jgi:hypothetical protein